MILNVGKKAIDFIFDEETGGKAYYEKCASRPVWPKGSSGITVGAGYDLGYKTPQEILKDWSGLVNSDMIWLMQSVAGLRGQKAANALTKRIVSSIYIPFDVAKKQFLNRVLPVESALTVKTFPEADKLNPDTLGVLISLVYNRGADMTDNDVHSQDRREMRAIREAVKGKDYREIAKQLRSMKRLWDGVPDYVGDKEQRFGGLLDRRDGESGLVEQSIIKVFKPEEIQALII